MKINKVNLRNFRRLEDVEIDFGDKETVFVGPNNSGKTSATSAFKLFLKSLDFKIHDFSVSRIAEIDRFGLEEAGVEIPSLEMDLWLTIDPNIEFGRVFALLPNISAAVEEVGVRIQYSLSDAEKLKEAYFSAFPLQEDGLRAKSLSEYLTLSGNISAHFLAVYFTLEKIGEETVTHHMDADEARKTLSSIVRVDFVDAQRNIDDHEASRSTRLSQSFATYYKNNLQQPSVNEEANRVIDENNENLNQHYETSFGGLMEVLRDLGVPSVNDRELKLVSSLSPEAALRGNTSLLYIDISHDHELPEAYNGLGFKNLVYIAIRVSHFYLQWISTENKRPLCQLIFIEEPEVHLHSQVQQTFISNIWSIIDRVARQANEEESNPQICVTTHSSHILDAVDFKKVLYFKRCCLQGEDSNAVTTLNATKVMSLKSFQPNRESADGEVDSEEQVLSFLKKYMRLTHCDLFFSDAVILVEGAAEKLLLPAMIEKDAENLKNNYLSILEVGGAYSSRFAGLLEFLGISYLVITDIDSVDPANNRTSCRADLAGAVTSNSSIKFYLGDEQIESLKVRSNADSIIADNAGYIAFQRPTEIPLLGNVELLHGRTFEECFVYENIASFKDGSLSCGIDIDEDIEVVRETVYQRVKSSSFKKTEFALDMASTDIEWKTPTYITDGLNWLEDELNLTPEIEEGN